MNHDKHITNINTKRNTGMKVTIDDVIERLNKESAQTDYAEGVIKYAKHLLLNVICHGKNGEDKHTALPSRYAPLEAMLLWGCEDWEEYSEKCVVITDAEIAERLGLGKVLDIEKSDMRKVQGQALRSAFLLIWAEVCCLNRMRETFMIRRNG